MVWHEPLELRYWLINVFSGGTEIFVFIFAMFLAGLAGYFRMPTLVFMILLGLFAVIMSPFIGLGYFILFVTIAAMVFYSIITRLVKQ